MKADIHPKVYTIVAKCVCGGEYPTISTKPEMSMDVCSKCHPFYTGQSRLLDTEGRVSRFEKKYQHLKAPYQQAAPKAAVPTKAAAPAPVPPAKPKAKKVPAKKDS